ncbi:MerR family transcriptional regulator [Tsukamurella sp. 8F]|uniref:MerR family transcriptional regulator n=1 Tax=unclassified Tsukamurella TaxID=2633480 RepID=UPI0023B90905|nr:MULTISPECIES: MerR family transcriptional regulator [unclassified Tsukamurella]MDF0529218.1 MerR family transcriptional regulator [Tsukamurella sp. 8J]MDF0585403.1 MerR family transcriptional regulator [Tsukamurella sp. 8F]
MRIGQLARIVGISTRAIRHYHRIGLLEEPARESNGYRAYSLDDVVRLLRIRRLADLGMSLDEVGAALADDAGRDAAEILAELDAELADQQARIAERRSRIAEVVGLADSGLLSPRTAAIAERLRELYDDGATARVELAMMETFTALAPGSVDLYEAALADPGNVVRVSELESRFEALRDRAPDDPGVVAVADLAVRMGRGLSESAALVEESNEPAPMTPDDLVSSLDAMDGISVAQKRCIRLIVDAGRGGAW